jgi:hypothetical protein
MRRQSRTAPGPEPVAGPSQQDVELKARQGLAQLLAGDADAGLALYRQCFAGDFGGALPLGTHLEFLERGGRADMAAALRGLALASGGNLARNGTTLGGEPIDLIEEYETLFARGQINARMTLEYMLELSKRGQLDRVARVFDWARLLRIVRIDEALGPPTRDLLLRAEGDARFREQAQSVRNMRQIDNFETLGDPAPALLAALDAEAQRYLADWRASDHPFATLVPEHMFIKPWALISRGDGFNVPHVHHRGWATGVYYPIGLDAGPGGELCVGRPDQAAPGTADWPETRIRPEAGMLVLMPSFYTHSTVPLGRPGLRLSVAFDMMPVE